MKIAITADLHLKDRNSTPERYRSLENLLDQIKHLSISHLIIAGDLFDSQMRNYRDFDSVCKDPRFSDIQIYVLPGNHDISLTNGSLTAGNVTVCDHPEMIRFDLMSLPILMVPYHEEKNMGEEIEPFAHEFEPNHWILVGHGDWISGMQEPNPLEPGVYMPLTRTDVASYQPAQVILGHIHKSMDDGVVHYPGSPLPLDINETGKRRILVLDSETGQVESQPIGSEIIYLNESITVLPVEDEISLIARQIDSSFEKYELLEQEMKLLVIRVKVSGYSKDKRKLAEFLDTRLGAFKFYKDEGVNLEDVYLADDPDKNEVAGRVMMKIKDFAWQKKEYDPGKNQIVLEALHTIYGGA